MNCESEEEVRKRITDDMKQFNKDALANYKEYDTIFQDNLLTPYRNNLIELQKLYEQTTQLVNSINGLWVNDNNYTTPDQLLASSASKSELNLKTDYSDLMLKAKDESTFWALADYRNQKAAQLGQDLSGNNPNYRSNDQLYQEWLANNTQLQKDSKLQKNILDTNNNFWTAYNQTDSKLKDDSVLTTDSWVNEMCKEYVEYNNQYNQLNNGIGDNNAQLSYLQSQMSSIYDAIASRMSLSVEEIQTIGAQMVAAQQSVYDQMSALGQGIQSTYSGTTSGSGYSFDYSKSGSTSGMDYVQEDDGSWTDLHTGENTSSKPSSASSSNSTSKAAVRDSDGSGYWSTSKSVDTMRSEAQSALAKSSDGKIHIGGSYSDGVEEGPVTYTGLAMLHGTPSNPEFVLNSDQAYTLLRNMATTKLPEMQKVSGGETNSTQYIVQGDVVLENTNNPAQFWDDVSKAMSNRHNVTKNR